MFHLNIRSLVNKYEQLKIELEKTKIEIFSISETWLTAGVNPNILQISGYNLIRYDRAMVDIDKGLPKRGGGLAIYYADSLSCDTKKWAHFNISSSYIEIQVVEFVRDKARNIIFINVYRPPNGNVQLMVDHMTNILSNVPRIDRKDVIFMGDFNVDLLSNTPDTKKLIRFSELYGMVQNIKSPTRVSSMSSSMIDLIFSNVTHVCTSGVIDMYLSDHQPIFLIKKMNTSLGQKKMKRKFIGRTYRAYTPMAMQNLIDDTIDLNELMSLRDPTECWDCLYHSLISIADRIIPEKQYTVNNELPAWLTPELLNLKKDRDYFFKKAKITGDDGDWFIARNLRNRTNIAMRAAKAEYVKEQLSENKDNPKKFWKLINSEILPENNKTTFNFIDPVNNTLHHQDDIPNLINNYFSEIGPKLAQEITNVPMGNQIIGPRNPNIFDLEEFTLPELLTNIKTISIYKSSGLHSMSTRFFKDVMMYIPQLFLHLYNTVRLSGVFPDSWKIATVVPLPKVNDPKNPSELKPISLLPIVGKILEKLIHKQLSTFLENTNHLIETQHGFRKTTLNH